MDNEFLFAAGTALVSVGVSWGVMKATNQTNKADNAKLWTEIEEVKDDIDSIKEKYVTMDYFKAVVRPLQSQVSEIGRDVKTILSRLRDYDSR